MFENLKQQVKEKKIERLLHKILAELKEDEYDKEKIKAAFEGEREMKEVLSEIYSWYDDEAEYNDYYGNFRDYCDSRAEGYSKQWALWYVNVFVGFEDRLLSEGNKNKSMDLYMCRLICASHYYQDYKDTDVALRDVKLFISEGCRHLEDSVFKTACSDEMLLFCKKYKMSGDNRKYLGKQSFQDKYRKLEYAYLACLPSQTELKELPARVKRMDDDDKRDAWERYEPIMCKYFAHIIANKLDINIEDKYKDVVALTVLMGLGDEQFIYVDKAIKYVDSTLSFLGLNVPFQDVEKLCNAASEMCIREAALYREFLDSDLYPVEQLAKLVSEFGCTK